MKKTKELLLLCFSAFCLLNTANISAQEQEQTKQRDAHYTEKAFSHLNIAVGFSTLGTTIEVATPLASHLKLRAGVNFVDVTTEDSSIDINDPTGVLRKVFGEEVSYATNINAKTFHTNILVDFYPFKKGIFHVTGGLYIGESKLSAKGRVVNRTGADAQLQPGYDWPELEFDGHIITMNEGRINMELTLGNKIKPYLGIGLGRVVSKRRLGVRFEAGVLFSGEYKITQNGKSLPVSNSDVNNFSDIDKYKNLMKYYPMVKLQLNYRIL